MSEIDKLVITGRFEDQGGSPIAGAAIHKTFLGDPPSNLGTAFDLEDAPAHTDSAGQFRLTLSALDRALSRWGPPGTWRRGCFLVLAVKDARTIGYTIATGEELKNSPVRLTALPVADIRGRVVDEAGLPVAGAQVCVDLYLFFVGRGPYPEAPINFWLSRTRPQATPSWEKVIDLTALTDASGCFLIPNAPAMPGELRLSVSHPHFATLETDYYPHQPMMQLTMQAGAAVKVQLTLPDGTPAVGFEFNLEGLPEGAEASTHRDGTTDGMGRCEFLSLPSGSYTIRYLGGADRPWAVPAVMVTNLGKGERRRLTVRAVEGSVFCGRVLAAGSKAPVRHAEVRFESEAYPDTASTFQAAYTDVGGAFVFRYPVAPGPFEVCVSAQHEGKWVGERHRIVVSSEPRTDLTFYLPMPVSKSEVS
jgi:hypothetical protein